MAAIPAQEASLSGDWSYAVDNLKLGGDKPVTCQVVGDTIRLRQNQAVVGGFAHGGTLRCGSESQPVQPAQVDSGAVRADSLFFFIGPNKHRGAIHDNMVTGLVTLADGSKWISANFVMKRLK